LLLDILFLPKFVCFKVNRGRESDAVLIKKIQDGDKLALDKLVRKHEDFIFNVARKFYHNIADAEDATQEVLLKIIVNLSQFNSQKGQFQTWSYKIMANHFLKSKRSVPEVFFENFKTLEVLVHATQDSELEITAVEKEAAILETKVNCMTGMLMCLSREQRLIYILGAICKVPSTMGADIMRVSESNYRQLLHRAKKDLHSWMQHRCGLANPQNSCRCPKKTKGFIEQGWVDPHSKKWREQHYKEVQLVATTHVDVFSDNVDDICVQLFQSHPLLLKHEINQDQLAEWFNGKWFDNNRSNGPI
jgi:RNA polymerase sigma factor (sigma-70 family)